MLALPFPPMRRADGNKLLGFRIDRAVGVPGGRQTAKRVDHHRQFSRRRRLERHRQARLRAEAQREMPFQHSKAVGYARPTALPCRPAWALLLRSAALERPGLARMEAPTEL